MRIAVLIITVVVWIGLWPARGMAQDATPGPTLDASLLGAGWETVAATTDVPPVPEPLVEMFADGDAAVFGGPSGARVMVIALVTVDSPSATRRAWEAGNEIFEIYRGNIEFGYDISREDDLASREMPDGCADARRTYGTEKTIPRYAVGLTLCAADPNLLLFVVASGEVNGLTGYQASDVVVELLLGEATTD